LYVCTWCGTTKTSALDNKYGTPKLKWSGTSCKATFTCSVCGEKKEVECTVTEQKIRTNTVRSEGVSVYYASCDFQGEKYTSKKVGYTAMIPLDVSAEKINYTIYATEMLNLKIKSNDSEDAITSLVSSDEKIGEVQSNNWLLGKKAGTATMTISTRSGKQLKVNVTVKTPSVKLNKTKISVKRKKSTTGLKIKKKLGTDSVEKWISSNKKVVTVSKNGKIYGKKAGTAYVTVVMKSGAKARCKVQVKKK
jgi:hypothetical protein